MPELRVAGLVLAAGASSRLGEPKQLLTDAAGTPAVVRVARALADAGCPDVFVMLGANGDRIAPHLRDEAVHMVWHDGWSAGMGSSIAAGVRAISAFTAESPAHAVLITPCDMPSVTAEHLRGLLQRFDGQSRVASSYETDSGHDVLGIPAILPRRDFAWLSALDGEQGARALFREPGTVAVPLPLGDFDLDTPADVSRWRQVHLKHSPP